jgi:hypothetical protein
MEVSYQPHDPATLPPGKNPWHLPKRRLCRSQGQSTHFSGEKRILPLMESVPQIVQPVAVVTILTTLSQLPNMSNNLEIYELRIVLNSVLYSIMHSS